MALSPPNADTHGCPAWVGPVKFILLAIAVVSLYFLCEAMVKHQFFSGGYLNDRIVNMPPAH